jgi:molecular chaperone GrpE (heat shock protein)
MLDICPTRPANVKGTHYRPRKEAKSRRKTVALLQTTARMMHRLRTTAATDNTEDGTEAEVVALAERYEERHPEATREEALKATQACLREKQNRIDKEHTKIQEQEATSAFRTLLDSNQKLGNKLALGKHKPNPPVALRAVQTPEGRLATTAEEVIEATERWARNKMKAPEPNGKTGRYLPAEAPRHYPWETTDLSDDGDPMADNLPTGPIGYS